METLGNAHKVRLVIQNKKKIYLQHYLQYYKHIFVNTLRARQNGRRFPDDILKWIFLNENVWISIRITLKFIPKILIHNWPSSDKLLSEPMMVNFTDAYMRQSASMSYLFSHCRLGCNGCIDKLEQHANWSLSSCVKIMIRPFINATYLRICKIWKYLDDIFTTFCLLDGTSLIKGDRNSYFTRGMCQCKSESRLWRQINWPIDTVFISIWFIWLLFCA